MTPIGNFREHIAYVTVGVITELIISKRLEYDRKLEQALRHLSTLSINGVRFCIRGLVVPMGKPRYVKVMVVIWQPKAPARSCMTPFETLIETIDDF
jgi:hypothetical protein